MGASGVLRGGGHLSREPVNVDGQPRRVKPPPPPHSFSRLNSHARIPYNAEMTQATPPKNGSATPEARRAFTLHDRLWQQNRYVYPVVSRRSKGVSIGVNLNPDKVCNFDC